MASTRAGRWIQQPSYKAFVPAHLPPRPPFKFSAELTRLLSDKGRALSGWRSLPFPRPSRLKSGDVWRVAVKVIDPRANEGLRVVEMH